MGKPTARVRGAGSSLEAAGPHAAANGEDELIGGLGDGPAHKSHARPPARREDRPAAAHRQAPAPGDACAGAEALELVEGVEGLPRLAVGVRKRVETGATEGPDLCRPLENGRDVAGEMTCACWIEQDDGVKAGERANGYGAMPSPRKRFDLGNLARRIGALTGVGKQRVGKVCKQDGGYAVVAHARAGANKGDASREACGGAARATRTAGAGGVVA